VGRRGGQGVAETAGEAGATLHSACPRSRDEHIRAVTTTGQIRHLCSTSFKSSPHSSLCPRPLPPRPPLALHRSHWHGGFGIPWQPLPRSLAARTPARDWTRRTLVGRRARARRGPGVHAHLDAATRAPGHCRARVGRWAGARRGRHDWSTSTPARYRYPQEKSRSGRSSPRPARRRSRRRVGAPGRRPHELSAKSRLRSGRRPELGCQRGPARAHLPWVRRPGLPAGLLAAARARGHGNG
jgi:hypothetical protein